MASYIQLIRPAPRGRTALSGEGFQELGKMKVLKPRIVALPDDFDRLSTLRVSVVVPRDLSPKVAKAAVAEAIANVYTATCHHEYDCCGCHFARTRVTRQGRRNYSVLINRYLNY